MWRRFVILKISFDLGFLRMVIRNIGKGHWEVVGCSGVERRVFVICLTLMTSKPRPNRISAISSAGVLFGRWRINALRGFSDLGKKVK
jgi:hypothetical protein